MRWPLRTGAVSKRFDDEEVPFPKRNAMGGKGEKDSVIFAVMWAKPID